MNLTDLTGPVPPVHANKLENAPFDITYVFPTKDFGAGDHLEVIESPPGFRGKVRAITLYDVTETFNAVTTPANVQIGITGDTDAFAIGASLGTLASAASISSVLTDGATHIIQPGTTIHVTGIAPTGGTEAGIATVAVTIQYFK